VTSVGVVLNATEKLWPAGGAESWDAVGLVVGRRDDAVSHIRFTVDVTPEVIRDAVDAGADFIIAHHPLLLRGVTTVSEETYKGACITELIRSRIGLLVAHTNADIVDNGVSDVIARRLGLQNTSPIVPSQHDKSVGIGRVGTLAEPMTLGALARVIAEILPATAQGIRASGDFERVVNRIALCGGAGDSLLSEPLVRSSDLFVTSDLRHHPASEFREWAKLENGPALIDVSHWASEWVWCDIAAEQLRNELTGVTISVSDVRTDPWDFVVVQ